MHPCDVLIVDEALECRDELTSLLRDEGVSALAACTRSEALGLLQMGLTPRVILLEEKLLQVDLADDAGESSSEPALAGRPVIVMSATTVSSVPVEATLQKPFQSADVLRVIWPFVRGAPYDPGL
jgi:CheY-like chemotaxis protein